MERVRKILMDYDEQLLAWQEKYPDLEFVHNNDYQTFIDKPLKLADVQLLLVGDNPGKKEKEYSEYFSTRGKAGGVADKFLHALLGADYRKENLLIFNKTPIHTPMTGDLKQVAKAPLEETQKYMAQMIQHMAHRLQVPVWIVGLGHRKKKQLFGAFFYQMCQVDDIDTYLTPHFSMSSIFQQRAYQSFPGQNPIEQFGLEHSDCTNEKGNVLLNQLIVKNKINLFWNQVIREVPLIQWFA